jgi:hypothetical protein
VCVFERSPTQLPPRPCPLTAAKSEIGRERTESPCPPRPASERVSPGGAAGMSWLLLVTLRSAVEGSTAKYLPKLNEAAKTNWFDLRLRKPSAFGRERARDF